MVKKIILITALVLVTGTLVFGAVNRTLAKSGSSETNSGGLTKLANQTTLDQSQGQSSGDGYRGGQGGDDRDPAGVLTNLPPADGSSLTDQEAAGLLYMREEEKLAHDVYVTLDGLWNVQTFANIASSEQTHTDAVAVLIERYGLTDPASAQAGVFTNPDLQALYHSLIEQGSRSLADALKVGAAIEELDILDLQTHLAQTDQTDIQQVYNSLLDGSGNHLNAFTRVLERQTGETYQAQYLSSEAYQQILGAGAGNTNGGQGGQGGQENRGARP